MTGTVNVLMNKNPPIRHLQNQPTVKKQSKLMWILEEQVIAEIKGTVSVSGVATANNALAGGGAFAISYPVTLP